MSTTSLIARDVMDRAASLMNDTARTVYHYVAVLPYLNMAIDELQETLQEHNMSPTNKTAATITLTVGQTMLTPTESATLPHYPFDLIEIEGVSERIAGTNDSFVLMARKDFLNSRTAATSLMEWMWQDQNIVFHGATTARELRLDYIKQPIQQAQNENSFIGTIGSRSYLGFKTASFCARFIGENPTRADELDELASEAIDRLLGIGAKGRQSMYTRRRPFRASYKSRGWV